MIRAYVPDTHDAILTGLITGWKLTDPEAAERMSFPLATIRANRARLGLPENRPPQLRPPQARLDALKIAEEHVRGFDRESMTLRGRPIKLDDVMKLANAELVKKELPQILYSERWGVPA
jgi:hypothetical protein